MDDLRFQWGRNDPQCLAVPVQDARLRLRVGGVVVAEDDLTESGVELSLVLGADYTAGCPIASVRQAVHETLTRISRGPGPTPRVGLLQLAYEELSPKLEAWLLKRALPEDLHDLINGTEAGSDAVLRDALLQRAQDRSQVLDDQARQPIPV